VEGEVIRRAIRAIRPVAILIIGAVGAIAYGYPGFMNFDSSSQLDQARKAVYDDWHPPFMARYWRMFDVFIHGPLPLFIVQLSLFLWGAHRLLSRRFAPQVAALLTVALLWFPPVLSPMGVVWKDAQMAAFLIAGASLAFGESWRERLGGIALLVCAAAVRDNATTALPPLLVFAAWRWGVRGVIKCCAVAFVVWAVITASAIGIDKHYTNKRMYAWTRANAIQDIAGMICFGDEMSDDEVRDELRGIPLRKHKDLQTWFCKQYSPRWWFPLSFNDDGLFETEPSVEDREARSAAYFRLLHDRPGAFVKHRWNVTKELLGLTPDGAEEPMCQSFAGTEGQAVLLKTQSSLSYTQRKLGERFKRYAGTLLFRPWAYLVFGLFLFGYGIYRRDGLVIATIGSGFLYEASFLIGAAGPAFRYSHWMITCVSVATLFVISDRIAIGVKQRR
jgi:hypothetical protein